jgi:hypothetical protein
MIPKVSAGLSGKIMRQPNAGTKRPAGSAAPSCAVRAKPCAKKASSKRSADCPRASRESQSGLAPVPDPSWATELQTIGEIVAQFLFVKSNHII